MLTQEQAREQLKQFRKTSWAQQASARVDKLPGPDAQAVRRLTLTKDRRVHWERHRVEVADAARHLDTLSAAQRRAGFAAVFPQLADAMERCWQRMKAEPYTGDAYFGHVATPFRCPDDPSLTHLRRGNWLNTLTRELDQIDQDACWLAQWAPYLSSYGVADCIGSLLAAAIDEGGESGGQVLNILIDSANGDHAIGAMGRHIPRALLSCGREDAWAYMEKFLLAAQRQEGLRQAILETVDYAHPQAFERMLKLILDENLARFASVVRAADIWFALNWDSASTGVIKQSIQRALKYLDDPDAQAQALVGTDAEEAYFALWAQGVRDAAAAAEHATTLLQHDAAEMRFTGIWVLRLLQHPTGIDAAAAALDDEDLRVVNIALDILNRLRPGEPQPAGVFDRLEALIGRVPKKPQKLEPLLFPWLEFKFQKTEVANAMPRFADDAAFGRLLKHVPSMSPDGRSAFVRDLGKKKALPEGGRELLLKLTGDASSYVREQAIKRLGQSDIQPGEAEQLEKLLTRKAGDLRRGVLSLLRKQEPAAALDSADRLLSAKSKPQRAAGVELLTTLADRKPAAAEACRERAQRFVDDCKDLTEREQRLLDPLLGIKREKPTLDNALGLMDPAKLTPARPMKDRKTKLMTKQAVKLLESLDALIHAYREMPVKVWGYDGEQETLLGNAQHGLVSYTAPDHVKEGDDFPFAKLWDGWHKDRPRACRDKDGQEYTRAAILLSRGLYDYRGNPRADEMAAVKQATGVDVRKFKLRYWSTVMDVMRWLTQRHVARRDPGLLLDAAESALAQAAKGKAPLRDIRSHESIFSAWVQEVVAAHDDTWTDAQTRRLVELLVWIDKPIDAKGRDLATPAAINAANKGRDSWRTFNKRARMSCKWLAHAVRLGVYNEHDLNDHLLGPRNSERNGARYSFESLGMFTSRKPSEWLQIAPSLAEFADRARQRVLEVELARGDEPTAASPAASSIRHIAGAHWVTKFVKALGKDAFARGYAYSDAGLNRKNIFSNLIRVCSPAEDDTPETFRQAVADAGLTDKRLVELGMFAPQWAGLIEQTLGWDGYEDAVWWTHAHTKDDQWSVQAEVREAWAAAVAERTPLESKDLLDGAVDVAWFGATYQRLKKKRWAEVDAAAKNASSSGGHKRAQLFADAMLGNVTKTELLKRIDEKRHKDAVRALGLLPLQRGRSREKDLLSRYQLMQEFVRTSKKFGQMRQASEKRAAEIGQANLARAAGYPDPLRLQWAMEAKAIEDLKDGSLTVAAGETEVTLRISDTGEPEVAVVKAGKPLKSIPAKAKKDKRVKALASRKTELKRQASRMRKSLEQMMCKGETFDAAELVSLCAHPLMRPMLERLVFLGEGVAGFPDKGGRVLVDHAGNVEPIKKAEKLRIAHPHDLLERGDWPKWQHVLFAAERVQPIKQAYRELYVLTDAERRESKASKRYAGHQVNPRQALALLGGRGWVTLAEEGVRKTYHEADLSAWVEFQEGFYTPAEVDGLTVENVRFTRPGKWESVPLEDIPPRIFSEVMRDLDLVVSVAHRGGVDPEASASTIQMRSDLLRETLAVLSIDNVRIENNHALIAGEHANYSLHLGSAVTHLMPGGSLFIVAVHSQHRGRLFLPFADDDPKTAEVMSKTLLLARDREIKDPNILDQIRTRAT